MRIVESPTEGNQIVCLGLAGWPCSKLQTKVTDCPAFLHRVCIIHNTGESSPPRGDWWFVSTAIEKMAHAPTSRVIFRGDGGFLGIYSLSLSLERRSSRFPGTMILSEPGMWK